MRQLAEVLPEHSVALADLAAELTSAVVDPACWRLDEIEETNIADLPEWLNYQSNRLAALGRREDAPAAITEAFALYRELAAASPDALRPTSPAR